MANENNKGLISVTGLWRHTGPSGRVFYSGNMGNVSVFVFENEDTSGNKPCFSLCLGQNSRIARPASSEAPSTVEAETPEEAAVSAEDDLPF